MPTPAYVQYGIEENAGSSPSIISLTGATAGNILCVMAFNTGSSGVTWSTPSDTFNTYVACDNANIGSSTFLGGCQLNSWWATNTHSGSLSISVPWTGSKTNIGTYVFEISGATVYDNGAGATVPATDAPGTASTGNFTTAYQDLIICINANNGSASNGPGYTLISVTIDYGTVLEYGLFSAGTNAGLTSFSYEQDSVTIAAAFGYYIAPINTIPPQPTDAIFYGIM